MEGKEKSGITVELNYEAFAALVGLCKAACEAGQRLMAGTFTAGDREAARRALAAGNTMARAIIDSGAVDRDDAVAYAVGAMRNVKGGE